MDGIILINKPKDYTSRDIVNIVGKKLKIKKIGHTGTLDPLATGVLVICVGKATKLVEILTSDDKEYVAGITLGLLTDTLDIEGKILKKENVSFSKEEIIKVLDSIKGKYYQEVPIYSAVKVNGKKLYEYARNNEQIKLPKREVEIKEIKLISELNYEDNTVSFDIKCTVSKGTYIRALTRDIALKLNTVGIMHSLKRTRQGIFNIDICNSIEQINDNNFAILPLEYILKDYFKVEMDEQLKFKVINGCKINNIYNKEKVVFLDNKKIIALYKNYDGILKPWKMFL